MTENEAFLANIRENPDDDLPRLIYADWLTDRGDPRGEFIRLQCEVVRMDAGDPRRSALARRATSLGREYIRDWRRGLPRLRGIRWGGFEGGFIGSVLATSVGALLRSLPQVLAAAPTATIRVDPLEPGDLRTLFAHSHASQIRSLRIEFDRGGFGDVVDLATSPNATGLRSLSVARTEDGRSVAAAIATSLHLAGLRRLNLRGLGVADDDGVIELADSKHLASLTHLGLASNRISSEAVQTLATTARFRLTELYLSSSAVDDRGVRALAQGPRLSGLSALRVADCSARNLDELLASSHRPHLTSLAMCAVALGGLRPEVLGTAPCGTALRRLALRHSHVSGTGARHLAGCPRLADLRELSVSHSRLQDDGAATLATSPFLADLRLLMLEGNHIGDCGATALAGGRWRRLEAVNLESNEIGNAGVRALVTSPLGKHTSVLKVAWNRFGGEGRELLRRRRVRPWPTTGEEPT